jgi:hypothetical protein
MEIILTLAIIQSQPRYAPPRYRHLCSAPAYARRGEYIAIMSWAERDVYQQLSPEARERFWAQVSARHGCTF